MRCRYHALLQILGFVAVVAFHAEMPGMAGGWVAVELFFALAGFNMARMLRESSTFRDYLVARYRRLTLPLLLLVPAVVLLIARGSKSAVTFAVFAPLQMHNLWRVSMGELWETDIAWVPSWFVASLFQLQLLVFLVRGALLTAHVRVLVFVATAIGLAFRGSAGQLFVEADGTLTAGAADALYWAPLTHVEALVGGLLLGLGRLQLSRRAADAGFAVVGVGVGALAVGLALVDYSWLGFPLGQDAAGAHVWGYLALAFAAVVVVDKRQFVARWILSWKLSPKIDAAIESVSRLTFVGYVLHGTVLAFVTRGLLRLMRGAPFSQSAIALAVTIGVAALSLLLAATLGQLGGHFSRWTTARRG